MSDICKFFLPEIGEHGACNPAHHPEIKDPQDIDMVTQFCRGKFRDCNIFQRYEEDPEGFEEYIFNLMETMSDV